MAARGTVIRPTNIQLPVLQLPFEQLFSTMQNYQQDYDAIGGLTDLMPNYLEKDNEWAGKYRDYSKAVSESVTQAFAEGDTTKAMRMLNSAKQALGDEWKPGGLANALQSRYEGYQKGVGELKKAGEKDPTNLNFQYGLNQFDKGVKDLNYDYQSRKYNQVGSATPYNYTDINQKLIENVKAVDADITEQDIISGMWIQRLKSKGYDDSRINAVWEGIKNDPGVAQQLEVEAYGKLGNLSQEDLTSLLDKDQQARLSEANKAKSKVGKMDVSTMQKFLKEQGLYKGAVDGKKGKLTNDALEKYNQSLDNQVAKYEQYREDPYAYAKQQYVVNPVKQQFMGYFGSEESKLIRPNQVALEDLRFKRQKQLQDREFMLNQKLTESNIRGATYTPTVPQDISKEFTQLYNEAKSNVETIKSEYGKLLATPGIKQSLGLTGDINQDHSKVYRYLEAYDKSGGDMTKFADALGLKPEQADQAFKTIQRDGTTISKQIADLSSAEEAVSNANRIHSQVNLEVGGNKLKEYYNKYKKDGESIEEFSLALAEASKLSNKELTGKYERFKLTKAVPTGGYNEFIKPKYQEVNLASNLMSDLDKTVNQAFKEGKTPKSLVRYTAVGQSKDYGAGQISDRVKTDINTRNFYGYADARTGNSDKFQVAGSNKVVKWNDIDIKTVSAVYDNGEYAITAKLKSDDSKADNYVTFRTKIPESHKSEVDLNLQQEMAIAVNDQNFSAAAKTARDLEHRTNKVLKSAFGMIEPTNETISGNKLSVTVNNKKLDINQPFTVVKEDEYPGGGKLRLVVFNDIDGSKRYANVLFDGNTSRLLGKAEFDGVVPKPAKNKTVSDTFFDSSDIALDNYLLFKWTPQLPIQDIYETIPKDLQGLGLGTTKLRATQLPETNLNEE